MGRGGQRCFVYDLTPTTLEAMKWLEDQIAEADKEYDSISDEDLEL
ncbi:MAG: hypothetical protein LBI10_02745 [Deltaproteobacteria bacterium]|nr:hypothetical protein [Deltaproteobacteria bacterium]